MKKWIPLALLLTACPAHEKEFDAVEGWLDARIALREAEVKSAKSGVLPLATTPSPEPKLPLANALEGAESAKRRARIEAKRALLKQLDLTLEQLVAQQLKQSAQ